MKKSPILSVVGLLKYINNIYIIKSIMNKNVKFYTKNI